MELGDVLRRRRMVRNFAPRPLEEATLDAVLRAGLRVPSAGFTQGIDLLVLETPAARRSFWEATTTVEWRGTTRRAGLMNAAVVVVPICDPLAYAIRYREADKLGSGLEDPEAWPLPYWLVDAAFTTMVLLLAAVDAGIGAAFLGMFRGEDRLLAHFGVPAERRAVGSVLLGHPALPDPPSTSLARGRREFGEVVHREEW